MSGLYWRTAIIEKAILLLHPMNMKLKYHAGIFQALKDKNEKDSIELDLHYSLTDISKQ
jgi:hypothetical protein